MYDAAGASGHVTYEEYRRYVIFSKIQNESNNIAWSNPNNLKHSSLHDKDLHKRYRLREEDEEARA